MATMPLAAPSTAVTAAIVILIGSAIVGFRRPLLIVLPLDEWPLRMAGQDGPDRAEAGSKVNLCERQDLH